MPYGKRHNAQKRKNYLLLAILVALMAVFYVLTLLKISG